MQSFTTTGLGIAGLAIAFGGWILRSASTLERSAAGIAGVLLCHANGLSDAAGLGVLVIVVVGHMLRTRRRIAAPAT